MRSGINQMMMDTQTRMQIGSAFWAREKMKQEGAQVARGMNWNGTVELVQIQDRDGNVLQTCRAELFDELMTTGKVIR